MILLWVKVGITLVADSDFISCAALYKHPMLGTCVTNQAATSATMMPSVKLKAERKQRQITIYK